MQRTGTRRWLRVLAWIAAALGVLLLAVVLFGVYLMRTDAGRRTVARRLERFASDALPGSLRIGALERLESDRAVLRDLRFMDPNGQVVLHARHVAIEFDPRDFLKKRIELERARVDGGFLVVAVQPDGRTGLESAFDAPGPGGEPARIALRAIRVDDFALALRPDDETVFRLRDVSGFVGVSQSGPPGVQVRLEAIRGEVEEPTFLGERAELARVDGWVHGGAKQVLRLEVDARLDDEPFGALIDYYPRDENAVVLQVDPGDGVKTHLAVIGAKLQSLLSEKVDVRVD